MRGAQQQPMCRCVFYLRRMDDQETPEMLVGAIHSTMQRGAPSHPLERKESAILLTYERTSNISTVVRSSK